MTSCHLVRASVAPLLHDWHASLVWLSAGLKKAHGTDPSPATGFQADPRLHHLAWEWKEWKFQICESLLWPVKSRNSVYCTTLLPFFEMIYGTIYLLEVWHSPWILMGQKTAVLFGWEISGAMLVRLLGCSTSKVSLCSVQVSSSLQGYFNLCSYWENGWEPRSITKF